MLLHSEFISYEELLAVTLSSWLTTRKPQQLIYHNEMHTAMLEPSE